VYDGFGGTVDIIVDNRLVKLVLGSEFGSCSF
jgi:hypothetical protein